MQQSIVWTGMTMLVLSACIERTESEKDLSSLEEPSSEPAGEPGSSNGSDGSTGGSGGSVETLVQVAIQMIQMAVQEETLGVSHQ